MAASVMYVATVALLFILNSSIDLTTSQALVGPLVEGDIRDCEISKSDEFRDPQNMKNRPNYLYHGLKNSCSRGPCVKNASCVPNFESDDFQCECPSGFTGEACAVGEYVDKYKTHQPRDVGCGGVGGLGGKINKKMSRNVDECAKQLDNCHYYAHCNNTLGSYECLCKDGFAGNGRLCVDINECTRTLHNCHHPNATCINTVGSFSCTCKPGFEGDGITICEECRTPLGMESLAIADAQISASSEYNASYAASHARLYYKGGWVAATNDENQWLEVDMENQLTRVARISTQGAHSDGSVLG
ncbi:unnamed protein product [Porites evermanni]|uniref:Uncharacterized protein n=1 Tax=Porites evermanni TaxID=104178 RepID=A0ABN8L9L2_9CNID|nr:unnamed protein product [Porites evermanni]